LRKRCAYCGRYFEPDVRVGAQNHRNRQDSDIIKLLFIFKYLGCFLPIPEHPVLYPKIPLFSGKLLQYYCKIKTSFEA